MADVYRVSGRGFSTLVESNTIREVRQVFKPSPQTRNFGQISIVPASRVDVEALTFMDGPILSPSDTLRKLIVH